MALKTKQAKSINLALQGGGSHGAFSWGVLDYFLEHDEIVIEALSGTSAGAINAALLVSGFETDGRAGAKRCLASFWQAVSQTGFHHLFPRSIINQYQGQWDLDDSPLFLWFDLMSRVTSPYQFNPTELNPLKSLVESSIDFDCLNRCEAIKVFVSATNVESGQAKLFHNHEIDVDVIMASACLPLLFRAVEIEQTPYWDGGFIGNPVLYPFFYECDSADVVIVKINPFYRPGTPKTAREILNRIDEINFNTSLIKDLRAIRFVQRLLDQHKIDEQHYKRMLIHIVDGDEFILPLGASSKFNTEWEFIQYLHDCGRKVADDWLKKNRRHLGKRSSFDLDALFETQGE